MSHTKQSISKKTSNPVILNLIENQSKYKKYLSAFTLVELIVVIVILAILATIAFLSFNSYSSSSRDSVRLSDISNIAKGLTLQYTVGGYYILPDNSVNLYSGSTLIGYQGKAGSNTLNTIKLSANTNNTSGRDPIDNTYYTYNTNINKNRYQVTGYLENKGTIINRTSSINNNNGLLSFGVKGNGVEESINSVIPAEAGIFHILSYIKNDYLKDISTTLRSAQYDDNSFQINQTYATTYTNRFPYLKGDSIGVILNYTGTTSNPIYTPIEDITTSTGIDISSGTLTSGKVVISNNTDSSTGVSTQTMSGYTAVNTLNNGPKPDGTVGNPGLSCNDLKTNGGINVDGIYYIKPSGSTAFQTYCDMTTDGGGRTLTAKITNGNTWTYSGLYWTVAGNNYNDSTYILNSGEAKYKSFDTVAFNQIKILNPSNSNRAIYSISSSSLQNLFATSATGTSLGVVVYDTGVLSRIGSDAGGWNICPNGLNYMMSNLSLIKINVQSSQWTNEGYTNLAWTRIGYPIQGSNANWYAQSASCVVGLGGFVYGYNNTYYYFGSSSPINSLWVK